MSEAAIATNKGGPGRGYQREPAPGGKFPDLGTLFSGSLNDVVDNIGGYAIQALVLSLVYLPVLMICIVLLYAAIFGVIFGGVVGTLVVSVGAAEAIGGDAGAAVGVVLMLVCYVLTAIVLVLAVFAAMSPMLLLSPFRAAATRAAAKHQRGEITLKGTEFLSLWSENAVNVILVDAAVMVAVSVGVLFFYVGALVPFVLFMFAPGLVALHQMSWLDALRTSARMSMKHLDFFGVFALIYFFVTMVASYVPVLGAAYLQSVHTRAHREVFGDGEQPTLTVKAA